jgi:hypothetical protein
MDGQCFPAFLRRVHVFGVIFYLLCFLFSGCETCFEIVTSLDFFHNPMLQGDYSNPHHMNA